MLRKECFLLCAFALCYSTAVYGQDVKPIVRQAVQTELDADRDDHTHWLYFETDSKPERSVKQWVAETPNGNVRRVIEVNGQKLPKSDQRSRMQSFLEDSSVRSRQRKSEQHDDQEAAEMLRMLPNAFIWSDQGRKDNCIILHFRPDPQFNPPDMESRVFGAMEGEMAVDAKQHRIVSLKGHLIHDVKILGGLVGALNAGGTFDVERRMTGDSVWQITETHVHIQGHILIFKSISEQEDDVKTDFKELPADISLQQAENDLFAGVKEVN